MNENKEIQSLKRNAIGFFGLGIALVTLLIIILDLSISFYYILIFFGLLFVLSVFRNGGKDIDGIRSLQLKHIRKIDLLLYFLLFELVYLILEGLYYYLPGNFKIIHNCSSSTLYFLSSLVQSEAAIVAIVISLTFIAVTFAVDKYSTRTNEIFKGIFPDFWILLFIYCITIIFGMVLLNCISCDLLIGKIFPHHDNLFSITVLAAYSLSCLFLYSWNVLLILRPENIAALYSYKIEPKHNPSISDEESGYIQGIFDILRTFLGKNDANAVYAILWYLNSLTERILNHPDSKEQLSDGRLQYISILMNKDLEENIKKLFSEDLRKIERYGKDIDPFVAQISHPYDRRQKQD